MNNLLIVVIHYNDTIGLERCLNSISDYANENFHVIVIDDCSSTESKFSLNKLFDKIYQFHFLSVIYNTVNSGPSFSRNVGIDYAIKNNYSYISFIDSDDHLIGKIISDEYQENEITFFNSVETVNNYLDYKDYILNILKHNKFLTTDINLHIKKYTIQPNKVPLLTSCWSKIYSVPTLKSNNIRFNNKMKTFEDVDFLVRFLTVATSYSFNKRLLYAHSNKKSGSSATFGLASDFKSLFSFLQVSRSLRIYYRLRLPNESFNIKHFNACYYSISLTRSAVHVNSWTSFLIFFEFVNKKIKSRVLLQSFLNYDVKLAGGDFLIKKLIIFNFPFLLTLYFILKVFQRYYWSNRLIKK